MDVFVDHLTLQRHWNDGNWIGVTVPGMAELFRLLNHDEIDLAIYIYFTYDITIFTSQKLDMIGICTLSYSIDVETYHFNSPWLPHLTFFVEQMPGAERLHHPHPAGHSATISTRRGMERLNVYI